jgi:hypothetical protein
MRAFALRAQPLSARHAVRVHARYVVCTWAPIAAQQVAYAETLAASHLMVTLSIFDVIVFEVSRCGPRAYGRRRLGEQCL